MPTPRVSRAAPAPAQRLARHAARLAARPRRSASTASSTGTTCYPLSGDPDGASFEALTVVAAMAEVDRARSRSARCVHCNSYRNPEYLADAYRTIDHISGRPRAARDRRRLVRARLRRVRLRVRHRRHAGSPRSSRRCRGSRRAGPSSTRRRQRGAHPDPDRWRRGQADPEARRPPRADLARVRRRRRLPGEVGDPGRPLRRRGPRPGGDRALLGGRQPHGRRARHAARGRRDAHDHGHERQRVGLRPRAAARAGAVARRAALGPTTPQATSRSFCASARDCSFLSDWFSIWRMRSRVTLNVRPTSSSVRGCSPPSP